MDSMLSLLKGVYNDRIITGKERVVDLGWRSNIIVDRCRYLLASFMRGDRATRGIHFLAVGKGEEDWDTVPPASSQRDQIALTDPHPFHIRISPRQMVYLDTAGNPTNVPSNRIQVRVILKPGTPPISEGETSYALREFGLFGRLGRENYMIDYVRHAVIHKQAEDTLTRTIRLIF